MPATSRWKLSSTSRVTTSGQPAWFSALEMMGKYTSWHSLNIWPSISAVSSPGATASSMLAALMAPRASLTKYAAFLNLAGGVRLASRSLSLSAKKTHMHSALSKKVVMAAASSGLASSFWYRSALTPSFRLTHSCSQAWRGSLGASAAIEVPPASPRSMAAVARTLATTGSGWRSTRTSP